MPEGDVHDAGVREAELLGAREHDLLCELKLRGPGQLALEHPARVAEHRGSDAAGGCGSGAGPARGTSTRLAAHGTGGFRLAIPIWASVRPRLLMAERPSRARLIAASSIAAAS